LNSNRIQFKETLAPEVSAPYKFACGIHVLLAVATLLLFSDEVGRTKVKEK
jgi:hypothetical protein